MPTLGGEIQGAKPPISVTGSISEAMKSPSSGDGSQSLLALVPGGVVDQDAVRRGVDVLELADLAMERDVRQRQLEVVAGRAR